jgi:sensor c-di-GMP phosphodiesterase-like protein
MGCDIGQGFLLAAPMPKADFIKLLEKRAAHQAPHPAEATPTKVAVR